MQKIQGNKVKNSSLLGVIPVLSEEIQTLNPQQFSGTGCCGDKLSAAPQTWTAEVSPQMKMQWQVRPIRQQCPAPAVFTPDTVPQLAEICIHRQSSGNGQFSRCRWQEYGGKILFLSYMYNIGKQRIPLLLIIE